MKKALGVLVGMTSTSESKGRRERQLRLWPGIAAVTLQWFGFWVMPRILPDTTIYAFFGAIALGLVVLLWWLFFGRAPLVERWGMLAAMVAAGFATSRIIDKSIAGGMMGFMFPVLSIPVWCLALVAGAAIGSRWGREQD